MQRAIHGVHAAEAKAAAADDVRMRLTSAATAAAARAKAKAKAKIARKEKKSSRSRGRGRGKGRGRGRRGGRGENSALVLESDGSEVVVLGGDGSSRVGNHGNHGDGDGVVRPLCMEPMDGNRLFGFNLMLLRWIESLPGSSNCIDYQYRNLLISEKPGDAMLINPNKSGCARSEGYNQKLHKRFKGIATMLRRSRRSSKNKNGLSGRSGGGSGAGNSGIGNSSGYSNAGDFDNGGGGGGSIGNTGHGAGIGGHGGGSGGGSSSKIVPASSSVTTAPPTASSSTSSSSSRRAERAKIRERDGGGLGSGGSSASYIADQRRDEREGQNLPINMQYRRLLQSRKRSTIVGKSGIQGRGLYARTAIMKGEMVIEYVGEVIRKELTEYREVN